MSSRIRLEWPRAEVVDFAADPAQQAVIDHRAGHLRVLAGPGTGKTSVIVAAVRRRISNGQSPDSLLVLTYGRMAATELRSRLTSAGGPAPVATTFHALAYRLVIGHQPGLRLMGAPEQESVLREIVQASSRLPADLEPARRSRGLTEQMRGFIARAQALGHGPDRGGADPLQAAASAVYGEYLDVIGFAGAVDYAEMIHRASRVIVESAPESIRRLQTVFVDEYQDTDPAQVTLLQHLAAYGAQVIAVGDPDQSVYGFRGADADGILRFPEEFGDRATRTIALGGTRRFGPQIAAVARRVVPRNALVGIPAGQVRAHRYPEALGDPADRVAFRVYESQAAASDHVADLLRRVRSGVSEVFPGLQLDWSQMAVVVRSGSRDLPVLKRAMLSAGIPVEIARDDVPLSAAPAVRTLLDVLRAAAGVDGGLTAERAHALLCSPLGGMEPRAVAQLGRALRRAADGRGRPSPGSGELIAGCLRDPDLLAGVAEDLAGPVTALATVLDLAVRRVAEQQPPARILDEIWRSTPWPRRLRSEALNGGRRAREANEALDAVMELFDQAARLDEAFESVRSVDTFLAQICDQIIPAAPNEQKPWSRDAVRLLTAHRAKGSQWPLVVVSGVQEGLWPDLRARPSLFVDPRGQDGSGWREQQLLEERRLFYVACTRAQRALLVTAVRSPADDGPQPSPFLGLAAGSEPIVEVPGRPRRPLTPMGVVAGLRRLLAEPDSSPAMRSAVWQRLQALGEVTDARGTRVFPWADPTTWWGHRSWTDNDTPWFDPAAPLPLSASGVDSYLRCPRRWFLERRVRATDVASPKLAFGNVLHLCAQAIAGGELAPDEQEVGRVLDEVWHAVGYEPGWQARFEREQARQATVRLLDWLRQAPGQYAGSEVEFDTEIRLPSGEEMRVRGKADRVDRVAAGTVVTDFKTGVRITQAQAATHLQMGIYRWIAELGGLGTTGRAVAQLLFLREDAPRTQAEPGPRSMRQDSADLADWLLPALDAAVAGIRAEMAVARPGDGCRTCVVAESCPADPRGAEVRP